MSETLQLTITYEEPDEDGWVVASVINVPGAMSQGERARRPVSTSSTLADEVLTPEDEVDVGTGEPLELTVAP